MLEKVRVQILVKSILKLDITLLPIDLIAERNMCTLHQLHFIFTGQIDIHYLFTIISYIKLFMRPDMIGNNSIFFFWLSHNTYDEVVVI